MTLPSPRICCLDLDTFFVSVERLLDPSLEGKPVVVGGKRSSRGVVVAASYEVREYGVRSGMSVRDASKLAPPDAVFLPGRHGVYSDYSKRVRELTERFTPIVRAASIDEQYLDFVGCEGLYRAPADADADETIERTVRNITSAIRKEVGLPASAGVATSKPLAKVACTLAKPAGVRMVRAGEEAAFLAPLPVRKFPGIGPVAENRLHRAGIERIGQLARADPRVLRRVFGVYSGRILRGARGQGSHDLGRERPAFWEHDPEGGTLGSISNERTFREDVGDPFSIESQLCMLCSRVCWRARKRGVQARTVTMKLRYSDFHTITRSRTVTPTDSELELYPVVKSLYRQGRVRSLPIRLVGLALSNLGYYDGQLTLFGTDAPLHAAVDSIREKYGFEAVAMATQHGRPGKSKDRARTRADA